MIPHDRQFDNGVVVLESSISAELTSNKDTYGDIIDPNMELDRDCVTLLRLAQKLAGVMRSENHDEYMVTEVMYRSMHFALDVTNGLIDKDDEPLLPIGLINFERPDLPEHLIQMVSDYLTTRLNIDGLLGKYMPEIDPSFTMHHYVEISAGLIFIIREQQLAERLMAEELERITPEDIIKDSM